MRRTLTVAAIGLSAAAFLAPMQAASAVCGPDLSAVGGPSCPSLCRSFYVEVDELDLALSMHCLA